MNLTESIRTAWTAVEASGVPDHVQEPAFKEVLRSMLGTTAMAGTRIVEPAPSDVGSKSSSNADESDSTFEEAEVMRAVAEETGVSVEKLEQIFHVDQSVVRLNGPSSRFGSSTADKARNIALIVTVVRKLGMAQPDTSFEVIRNAADSKHAYDSKNFATKHMVKVPGCVVKGDNKNRRLEVKSAGISAFAEVIEKVLSTP